MLGKLPVPGRPTILITVGQGPIALAVGAGGSCLDIFTLIYPFFSLSPSLWETVRYRLKYCLKGPLNPKQPTNLYISVKIGFEKYGVLTKLLNVVKPKFRFDHVQEFCYHVTCFLANIVHKPALIQIAL